MIRDALTVARREFRSYFDHATAYILLVVFLVVNSFFYFRNVFLTGEGTLRPMFNLLPWLLLFFVPAVAMRTLAEERNSGTIELVLAQPIGEMSFLLGKFAGVLAFIAVALLGTLGAVIGLSFGTDLYGGVVVAQYVGALLLSAGLVAIGIWASSLTRNQITAFIVAIAVVFFFYVVNLDVLQVGLPGWGRMIANRLGILNHFQNLTRGVIDLRDVVYFVTLSAAFLSLAYWSLLREQLNRRGSSYRTLQVGTVGLLAICLVVNLLGRHIRGRLDLTPGNLYTLSPATRSLLHGLDDVVTVDFFASDELPPQVGLLRRDVDDLLSDYKSAAGSNLQLVRYSPSEKNEGAKEAQKLGIPPIQFNVVGQEQFQVQKGYLGIAIQYAGQTKTIPVIRQTEDLEYKLTSAIQSLTEPSRPVVAFVTGQGEHDVANDLKSLANDLRENYTVQAINLAADSTGIPDSVDVLVDPGPTRPYSAAAARSLEAYSARGGNLLLMADGEQVQQRVMFALPQKHPTLDSLLNHYGVGISDALTYDLQSNGQVSMPSSSGMTYVVRYPLWPQVRPASDHVTVDRLSAVLMPWASPIDLTAADTSSVVPLLATTRYGGKLSGEFPVSPQRDWKSLAKNLSPQVVAVALLGKDGGKSSADSAGGGRGRMVLVGDADFATDRFASASPDNLTFVENAVSWLAEDQALIQIRSKNREPPPLLFASAGLRDAVKWGNLLFIPLLFALYGLYRLVRRRRMQHFRFGEEGAPPL